MFPRSAMPILTPAMIDDAARLDPDRTLATSFARPEARNGLISLILFNHEIARVADVVSEPGLGHIRLHWWREVVEQIYTGAPLRRHPVAEALAATVHSHNLPRSLLDSMIDARMLDLEAQPFATDSALEAWLDASFGNLIRLSFLVCGAPTLTLAHESIAKEAGRAWGRGVLLAGLGAWRKRAAVWLPVDGVDLAGVRSNDGQPVWPAPDLPAFRAALRQQESLVEGHRKAANKAIQKLPADHLAAVVYVSLASSLAKAVTRAADPFTPPEPRPLLLRQLKLVMATALQRV